MIIERKAREGRGRDEKKWSNECIRSKIERKRLWKRKRRGERRRVCRREMKEKGETRRE